MTSSGIESRAARIDSVEITDTDLSVALEDGRGVTVPLAWYPRLAHSLPSERANWRLIGRGEGIHWPDLDEDIRIEGILKGRPSGESAKSLNRWLAQRKSKS